MNKYLIRFNKSKGQPNRGTVDHAWRVFENNVEYIFKHVDIRVPCKDEVSKNGAGSDDWNIACEGYMTIDKETSTAIIENKISLKSNSNVKN